MTRSVSLIAALSFVALTGCVSLGMSQQQSETAYAVGAGATDGAILLGKLSPDATGTACMADDISYGILTSTRNVADGVNYTLADLAHAKLHTDGAKANAGCAAPAAVAKP